MFLYLQKTFTFEILSSERPPFSEFLAPFGSALFAKNGASPPKSWFSASPGNLVQNHMYQIIYQSINGLCLHNFALVLPLHIKTGRYKNIRDVASGKLRKMMANERVCNVCKTGNTEDERHFLFECNKYDEVCSTPQDIYELLCIQKYRILNLPHDQHLLYIMNDDRREYNQTMGNL